MQKLVGDSLKRMEILGYMQRDFAEYTWCLRTLGRRLRCFNIYKMDKNFPIGEAQQVVLKEISGPVLLLGYYQHYHQLYVPSLHCHGRC